MSTSLSRNLDWGKILERVTPQAKKNIQEIRTHHEDLKRQIYQLKNSIPVIDFERYKSILPASFTSIINEFKEKVVNFKPSKPNVTEKLTLLDQERETKLTESKEFISELNKEIQNLKDKLAQLRSAKPIDEMSADEIYALRPDIKVQFENALKRDIWLSSGEIPSEEEMKGKGHHH